MSIWLFAWNFSDTEVDLEEDLLSLKLLSSWCCAVEHYMYKAVVCSFIVSNPSHLLFHNSAIFSWWNIYSFRFFYFYVYFHFLGGNRQTHDFGKKMSHFLLVSNFISCYRLLGSQLTQITEILDTLPVIGLYCICLLYTSDVADE